MKKNLCCFCGEDYGKYGNNPMPANNDPKASCCDKCNLEIVVPARLKIMQSAIADKKAISNEEGKCPVCDSDSLDFDSAEIDDKCVNYPWTCEGCGATGTESYDMEFNGHYNIQDKGGNDIESN